MEFNTLQEYFYKLRNVRYFTLLTPLVIFTGLYLITNQNSPMTEQTSLVISLSLLLMGFGWLIGFFLFRAKLNRIRAQPSLRSRLDRYYALTIVRSCFNIVVCILPTLGFFLTNDISLAYVFGVSSIIFFFLWPTPAKVCNDLRLKGDERDMVLHKKG